MASPLIVEWRHLDVVCRKTQLNEEYSWLILTKPEHMVELSRQKEVSLWLQLEIG